MNTSATPEYGFTMGEKPAFTAGDTIYVTYNGLIKTWRVVSIRYAVGNGYRVELEPVYAEYTLP